MPGTWTNGLPTISPGVPTPGVLRSLPGLVQFPADTQLPRGAQPQSVAVTAFQIAAFSSLMSVNTATDGGAGTATNSVLMGRVVSAALSTAPGATYTMTLTNTNVTALSNVQAAVFSLTNTTPGIALVSITPGAGTVVFVVKNNGSANLNGTIVIAFQVSPN